VVPDQLVAELSSQWTGKPVSELIEALGQPDRSKIVEGRQFYRWRTIWKEGREAGNPGAGFGTDERSYCRVDVWVSEGTVAQFHIEGAQARCAKYIKQLRRS
jgi:hypothetical protein